jgi:hypothetical protein
MYLRVESSTEIRSTAKQFSEQLRKSFTRALTREVRFGSQKCEQVIYAAARYWFQFQFVGSGTSERAVFHFGVLIKEEHDAAKLIFSLSLPLAAEKTSTRDAYLLKHERSGKLLIARRTENKKPNVPFEKHELQFIVDSCLRPIQARHNKENVALIPVLGETNLDEASIAYLCAVFSHDLAISTRSRLTEIRVAKTYVDRCLEECTSVQLQPTFANPVRLATLIYHLRVWLKSEGNVFERIASSSDFLLTETRGGVVRTGYVFIEGNAEEVSTQVNLCAALAWHLPKCTLVLVHHAAILIADKEKRLLSLHRMGVVVFDDSSLIPKFSRQR